MKIKRIENKKKEREILQNTREKNNLDLNEKEIIQKCRKIEDYPLHYRVVLPSQALFIRKIDYKIRPEVA